MKTDNKSRKLEKKNVARRHSEVTCASSPLNAGVDDILLRFRTGNF